MKNRHFGKRLSYYSNRVKNWLKNDFKLQKFDKEHNATVKFVIPLLNLLGWSHLTKDMEFEYALYKEAGKRGRADIALYVKDDQKPKILVEVKRIQDKLGTGRQLLRYLHSTRIDYGIYTNGRELMLIDRRTPVAYKPEGLFIIKIEDFIKYKKVLAVLSKNSVKKGKLDKLVRFYHNKEFWSWLKSYEKRDSKYNLRLKYANEKLK